MTYLQIEFRIHISYKHLVFTKNNIISYHKVYPSVKLQGSRGLRQVGGVPVGNRRGFLALSRAHGLEDADNIGHKLPPSSGHCTTAQGEPG